MCVLDILSHILLYHRTALLSLAKERSAL